MQKKGTMRERHEEMKKKHRQWIEGEVRERVGRELAEIVAEYEGSQFPAADRPGERNEVCESMRRKGWYQLHWFQRQRRDETREEQKKEKEKQREEEEEERQGRRQRQDPRQKKRRTGRSRRGTDKGKKGEQGERGGGKEQ